MRKICSDNRDHFTRQRGLPIRRNAPLSRIRCVEQMPRTYLVFGDIEGKLDMGFAINFATHLVHSTRSTAARATCLKRDARLAGPLRLGVPGSGRRCSEKNGSRAMRN